MAALRVTVAGWSACSYFVRARVALQGIAALHSGLQVEVCEHADKPAYVQWLAQLKPRLGPSAASHTSSPIVWLNESDVRA